MGNAEVAVNPETPISVNATDNDDVNNQAFPGMDTFFSKNVSNFKMSLINVNSIRHKIGPLAKCLDDGNLDMLCIQETKLDDSFPDNQFYVPNFRLYRNDFKSNEGGIMMYVRNDIPQALYTEYDTCQINDHRGRVELLATELTLNKERWHIICIYKQPKVSISVFSSIIEDIMNMTLAKNIDNVVICGDFNIDMGKKNNQFSDTLDIYGLSNLINFPTCFKAKTPTTLDLFITNKPRRFLNKVAIDTGLSDWHHMICVSTKLYVPRRKASAITYRSYKRFNEEHFNNDIESIPFHVAEIFDDIDDSYWFSDTMLQDVIQQHAPIKKRMVKNNHVPYMNGGLRKAINVKNMLKRKYDKYRSGTTWSNYRTQRNLVTRMRRESIKVYMQDKCTGENMNNREFWNIVKPLISGKSSSRNESIILRENNDIITNSDQVCDILNKFYVSMTKDIGPDDSIKMEDTIDDIVNQYRDHESVLRIRENVDDGKHFSFTKVTRDDIFKILTNLNPKKAAGYDNIPPKLMKLGARSLCGPVTSLVNRSITEHVFPAGLKYANVTPIFKKDDNLDKKNYRPVSVLPCMSKVFEKVMISQLMSYFEDIFSPCISGFRRGHSCETVLLRFIDDIKTGLDSGKMTGALLMDLSKAFDCLPHKLLISKFHAYGVDPESCELLASYFRDRFQRVKIGNTVGSWECIDKGAPQGSLMGPFSYNAHSNDFMYMLIAGCRIYNYADDNTISVEGTHLRDIRLKIEDQTKRLIQWYEDNYMKVNPDKFQAIVFGRKDTDEVHFNVNDAIIKIEDQVKLLGVTFDHKLQFSTHVSDICRKAGRQLSVLKRLSNVLDEGAKMLLYNTFIFSNFNYCCMIWQFCSIHSSKKIEKIQLRSLRYVYNDFTSTYRQLLARSDKSLLLVNRQRSILYYVYKVLNENVPSYLYDMFSLDNNVYNTRCQLKVKQPAFNGLTHGYNSVSYQGSKLWNGLSNDFKSCETYKMFKYRMSKWKGSECSCNNCVQCTLINV